MKFRSISTNKYHWIASPFPWDSAMTNQRSTNLVRYWLISATYDNFISCLSLFATVRYKFQPNQKRCVSLFFNVFSEYVRSKTICLIGFNLCFSLKTNKHNLFDWLCLMFFFFGEGLSIRLAVQGMSINPQQPHTATGCQDTRPWQGWWQEQRRRNEELLRATQASGTEMDRDGRWRKLMVLWWENWVFWKLYMENGDFTMVLWWFNVVLWWFYDGMMVWWENMVA